MAFNTNNPVGSTDPRDLSDNSENFDKLANGTDPAYVDRLGNQRKSFAGMESEFASFIAASGYEFVGNYAAGITITGYQQVIKDVSGEFWRLSGSTNLPYTTSGAGLPEGGSFVAVGDAALRQELNGSLSSGQGANLVNGATIYVGSVAELEALSLAEGANVNLTDALRGGEFIYVSGDQSANVTADPSQGVWIATNGDATGASGAVKRLLKDVYHPEWWGAGVAGQNDSFKYNDAITWISNNGGGTLRTLSKIVEIDTGVAGGSGQPGYAFGGSGIFIKDNVTLDFNDAEVERMAGTSQARQMITTFNFFHGLQGTPNKNVHIRNIKEARGLGGIEGQGSAISLPEVDGWSIENVTTDLTDGDGIQYNLADNGILRNIKIGQYGRNGISPTSGINVDWYSVEVVGPATSGANPGIDIDAESNSSTETASGVWTAVSAKRLVLVDFWTASGGKFSQDIRMEGCRFGPSTPSVSIRSINPTIAKNLSIGDTCKVFVASNTSSTAGITFNNVSNARVNCTVEEDPDNTGAADIQGIRCQNLVEDMSLTGYEFKESTGTGTKRGLSVVDQAVDRINFMKAQGCSFGDIFLSGSDNEWSGCNINKLSLANVDSKRNRWDLGNIIKEVGFGFSSVEADQSNKHYIRKNGSLANQSFNSYEQTVTAGTTSITIPLPSASSSGRSALLVCGCSHVGDAAHWANRTSVLFYGTSTASAERTVISNTNDGTNASITVTNVTATEVTVSVTVKFLGTFSATILG